MNKKKLFFVATCATAVMMLGTFGLAACDNDGGDESGHEHKYINYVYNDDATCVTGGTETAKCEKCDETDTRISVDHPATGVHDFDVYTCKVCGEYSQDAPITEGLEYAEIVKDGVVVAYEVKGIGEADGSEIVIPKTNNDKPVTSIGQYAFDDCESITSVIIPNSVTSIGTGAFSYCAGLTSVSIPYGVTGIGRGAFRACEGLASIELPKSLTSIGEEAFVGCAFTSITIPSGVTDIGGAPFYLCGNLTSVTVQSGNNNYHVDGNCLIATKDKELLWGCGSSVIPTDGSVTKIGDGAFASRGDLISIAIPDGITSIGVAAFERCENMTSVTFPSTLKTIEGKSFKSCVGLTSIEIPNGVTSIDGAFTGCSGLTSVKLPNSLTSVGGFRGCEGLTKITIPDSVTRIDREAFSGCSGLADIEIPDSVTSIGQSAFEDTAIYDDEDNWEDGVLYIGNCLIHSIYEISGAYAIKQGTRVIADNAFDYRRDLTSIEIPSSVTSIGGGAFSDCDKLTSIEIPSSVTSIGEGAFSDCDKLTSISVQSGNVNYHVDGNCLIATKEKELLWGCGSSVIPSDGSVTSIGNNAFSDCRSLASITIPDSVTSIGSSAFSGCRSLTNIVISDSVTKIGEYAFEYTAYYYDESNWEDGVLYLGKNLVSVDYDISGVCAIKQGTRVIADGAVSYCDGLTAVEIPNSVTVIGRDAFYGCGALTDITFNGTTEQWKAISKGEEWNYGIGGFTVICVDGILSKEEC